MAIILFGGIRETVLRQLECVHEWHGPCIDRVSRYNKCLKCFCLERDFQTEAEYWKAEKEARAHESEQR
jgi:hypothetical protein